MKLNLLAAGIVLAALGTSLGQSTVQFATTIYTVAENVGVANLSVQRTGETNTAASVNYATANGTATEALRVRETLSERGWGNT